MSMFTNQMRFTGFSGIDTDSMVRQIMQAESMRMHGFQRNRQIFQWRRQDFSEIREQLQSFNNRFLSSNGSDAIHMDRIMNSRTVSVTGNGVTATTSADRTTGTPPGDFTIDVRQIATSSRINGERVNNSITGNHFNVSDIGPTDTIRIGLNGGTSQDIPVGAKATLANIAADTAFANDPSIDRESYARNHFVTLLNDDLATRFGATSTGDPRVQVNLDISYNDHGFQLNRLSFDTTLPSDSMLITSGSGDALSVFGISSGSSNNMSLGQPITSFLGVGASSLFNSDNEASLTINGRTVTITSNMTVQEVMDTINQGTDVTMSFSTLSNSFNIVSDQLGSGNINISGGPFADRLLERTGLDAPNATTVAGQNAIMYVTTPSGGQATRVEHDSNEITLQGYNLRLNITQAAATATDPIVVTVQRDTERTRNTIENFVNEYNELVRELNRIRNTERPRGSGGTVFDPMLDHEREGLSDSEIARWEEQARIGHLHRSRDIEATLNEMRRALQQGVQMSDGTTMRLSDLGIQHTREGTVSLLTINEGQQTFGRDMDELLEELGPDRVSEFFSGVHTNLNQAFIDNNARLQRVMGTEGSRTGGGYSGRVADIDDRITRMQASLARRETALFAQFARMEQAIMQSNSQMDFLFQMFA